MSVLYQLWRGRDEVKVQFHDGMRLVTDSLSAGLYPHYRDLFRSNDEFSRVVRRGVFDFSYQGHDLSLRFIDHGHLNGDIVGVYFREEYKFLSPRGYTVVDVGANIGDSAIYFVVSGATKVLALEPYPYSYRAAVENVKLNHLEDKVVLLNAGYGADRVTRVEDKVTNENAPLAEVTDGVEIPLFSLRGLLNRYELGTKLLLKMDCEGCEYNLLHEDRETLQRFERMNVEYHHGQETLTRTLKDAGFEVGFAAINKDWGLIWAVRL